MKNYYYFVLFLILGLSQNRLFCGENDSLKHFELSGTISYSYDIDNGPFYYNLGSYYDFTVDPPILRDNIYKEYSSLTRQRFIVLPALGYYLSPSIELYFEPMFKITMEQNRDFIIPGKYYNLTVYEPGASIGIYYNFEIEHRIKPFFGLCIKTSWKKTNITQRIENTPITESDLGWSKPEVSFPSIAGGVKYYLSNNWAILGQFQYSKVLHWNIDNLEERDGASIVLSFGFLVCL